MDVHVMTLHLVHQAKLINVYVVRKMILLVPKVQIVFQAYVMVVFVNLLVLLHKLEVHMHQDAFAHLIMNVLLYIAI
jgi:hypothetical protein